jgi:hypothetical protein
MMGKIFTAPFFLGTRWLMSVSFLPYINRALGLLRKARMKIAAELDKISAHVRSA